MTMNQMRNSCKARSPPDVPDESDTEDVVQVPQNVELAPFPQDVADELEKARKLEDELAWVYDYISTGVGGHGHALDQYGVRIQKTSRPPYVHPDQWKEMKKEAREKEIAEFAVGKERLRVGRERVRELQGVIDEYHTRGGVRMVDPSRPYPFAATVDLSEKQNAEGARCSGQSRAGERDSSSACSDKFRTECGESMGQGSGQSRAYATYRRVEAADVAMPVVQHQQPHRELNPQHEFGFYACTARPVQHAERAWNKEAQAALQKEWNRLRACGEHGCWDERNPRGRWDVENEVRRKGETAHFGIVS